ncbi:MAG: zf-HC2 domain-containing protein [Blastocatellia bacterium]|nr:zf-HC2 domain-containing protein [Blastocatellia bacterium]
MTNKYKQTECGRKEDLIAYLYNECGAETRSSFEQHLAECLSCRDELNAFERVRDDLGEWEIDCVPRTEIDLPTGRADRLREFITFFPGWARGAALTAASLSLLAFSLSFAGIYPKGSAVNSDRIEALVKDAVEKERSRMQQENREQMAAYRDQLKAENETKLKALIAHQEGKLEAVKAELKRYNNRQNIQQNSSIRSFFAIDDSDDSVGDNR